MRIAQVAPLTESIPPQSYGGTERIVSYLEDALVRSGHEITVFASGDSQVKGKLIPCRDMAARLDTGKINCEMADSIRMLEKVRSMADDFDIIHLHMDLLPMPVFADMPEKTVMTLHGRLDLKGLRQFYKIYCRFPLVSISNYQRLPLAGINFARTIYHGIPEKYYEFSPEGNQEYLAFLGRFSPEKGAERAIGIAEKTGMDIRIAAKICTQSASNETYYLKMIKPLLDFPFVEYIGEIAEHEKSDFLGKAHALLMPISWPEPFGLVMIEAMACGTPVIAFRCGSVPEIIEDGVTGFIVDDVEEAVEAVKKIPSLDRSRIRKCFEKKYTDKIMAQNYEKLYQELIGARKARQAAIRPYQSSRAKEEVATVASSSLWHGGQGGGSYPRASG